MWPIVLKNQLILGNPKSNVAIVCGWTTREKTLRDLQAVDPTVMERVAAIGNLYSAERGVDMMLRNIIAHPHIDKIVFFGKDLSGACQDLSIFLAGHRYDLGTEDDSEGSSWYIQGTKIRFGGDLPENIIYEMRDKILAISAVNAEGAVAAVNTVFLEGPVRRMTREYLPPAVELDVLPGPYSVHPIRVKTIPEGYLELLYQIMRFGKRVETHYDQATMELMDLVTIIEDEPPLGRNRGQEETPNDWFLPAYGLPKFLPFDAEKLGAYIHTLLNGEKIEGVVYNYGNLMRSHFGIDQVSAVAQKLAKDPNSRSAVISLWDPKIEKSSPCLNHVWFRILDNKLFMTATIRSNDMFYGWPENAYGLRALQRYVNSLIQSHAGSFDQDDALGMGDLVIVSQSAHIYEDCWAGARQIVEENRKTPIVFDKKGNWNFVGSSGIIEANLINPNDGSWATRFSGTPKQVMERIARERLVSDLGHALWLGYELGKLEPKQEPPDGMGGP